MQSELRTFCARERLVRAEKSIRGAHVVLMEAVVFDLRFWLWKRFGFDRFFRCGGGCGSRERHRGVLVCGTGLGMSIAANKVKGAYAALLYGGSVNPENAPELIQRENIDGLFIGRSAWQARTSLRQSFGPFCRSGGKNR
ncbi:MAG: RpiB/LacA/LacB family sugar-phosphate isomerase [Oscillospiraceae bacterium]